MKMFVIMGNDYPKAVFSSEKAAEKFCAKKKAENQKAIRDGVGRYKIYWRYYDFEVDAA